MRYLPFLNVLRSVSTVASQTLTEMHGSFQLYGNFVQLSGERKRRRVCEIDRRTTVLTDVLSFVQRIFIGCGSLHATFADPCSIGEQSDRATFAHSIPVVLEVKC